MHESQRLSDECRTEPLSLASNNHRSNRSLFVEMQRGIHRTAQPANSARCKADHLRSLRCRTLMPRPPSPPPQVWRRPGVPRLSIAPNEPPLLWRVSVSLLEQS